LKFKNRAYDSLYDKVNFLALESITHVESTKFAAV